MTTLASHKEWFEKSEAYSQVPKELRSAGSSGVLMVRTVQPPGVYRRPGAPELSLAMPLTGGFNAIIDHGERMVVRHARPSDFALAPPQTDLLYETEAEFEAVAALIPTDFVHRALCGVEGLQAPMIAGDLGHLHRTLFQDEALSHLVLRLWREAEEGAPLGSLFADAGWTTVLSLLMLRASGSCVGKPKRGGLADWQLKRACEAMSARLEGDIGLPALAEIAGCSPTHFSRAFKQSVGQPPFAWLLQRRIERAKELLADPRVSLAEVALSVGFAAQPQFTTAFRRVTGTTPGAWRRERAR